MLSDLSPHSSVKMHNRSNLLFKIRISSTLIRPAKAAAKQMFANNERSVCLEKPFDSFYVTTKVSSVGDCFNIFTTRQLEIGGGKRKIYLYCESLFGKETGKG